jgi:crotonobetainyl-CoA:carnitine CoA-transferase CaiB-like acyl-CoA transferase
MGGAMSLTGAAGGAPARMGLPMGDLAGGMFGALAVASALFRRARTGEGAHFDLSLLDCQVSLLTYVAQYYWADGRVPGRVGSGHASVVPYQAFATRDGHVVVAVFAEKFWRGFCQAIERPDLATDSRFDSNPKRVECREELVPMLEALFSARTSAEWLARLQREGVPAAPINTVDQVVSDPQVRLRGMVADLEHPTLGTLKTLGTPVKPDGAPPFHPAAPSTLGQHTESVLRELLAYPPERIDALRRRRVVA